MKILYIDHYAGSLTHGMEFRPWYLSREWVKAGHEVVIVAASFSHLRQQNIEMQEPLREENIDGIRYVWFKTPAYQGNGLGRIKNMISFLIGLYRELPRITDSFLPDAVIASSTYPLDSYPANWIAKKCGAKFVFELHDMWPLSPMVLAHMSKWHPFIMVMQRGEDYWCKNADLVVSLLPDAYKHLTTRGMSMDKYVVIPNGIDVNEWEQNYEALPDFHTSVIANLKTSQKVIVTFAGGLVVANSLEFLLEAAEYLKNQEKIHFLIVGNGPEQRKIENIIHANNLINVTLLPAVPKRAIPALLGESDILVRTAKASLLDQFGASPNKIFDYMMSGKPILWSSSVKDNLVEQAKCGKTLSCNDPKEVAREILIMANMAQAELDDVGEHGRQFVLRNYTYPKLAEKFILALENH